MIGRTNALVAGGVDISRKPNIDFDGKWSGWHIEIYEGKPYWEALFASSGTLTNYDSAYTCDVWGIGGGGAGGYRYTGYEGRGGAAAGSGYTNMVENVTLPAKTTPITIGSGGNTQNTYNANSADSYTLGAKGGNTTFLTLTCAGGNGGGNSPGTGGSNGAGDSGSGSAGENGTPGDGKIMSKFWSVEHNTEYGSAGVKVGHNPPGGGGYTDVGGTDSTSGHGYGGGGGGFATSGAYTVGQYVLDWRGKSGCLIIRIPI